jgi:hypothetical protein
MLDKKGRENGAFDRLRNRLLAEPRELVPAELRPINSAGLPETLDDEASEPARSFPVRISNEVCDKTRNRTTNPNQSSEPQRPELWLKMGYPLHTTDESSSTR